MPEISGSQQTLEGFTHQPHTPIPPNQKIDFSLTVYDTNN
jgi:hypothetical protein